MPPEATPNQVPTESISTTISPEHPHLQTVISTSINRNTTNHNVQHNEPATNVNDGAPANKPPKFPSNAIRQRASNINVIDPDKEFLQTALDTCRSSIAQQETEIKKLKEALEIRNKRIIQLEGQVGYAANMVGGRHDANETTIPPPPSRSIEQTLLKINSKLDELAHPINPVNTINVYSNGCSNSNPTCSTNQSTQTDHTIDSCYNCEEPAPKESDLVNHIETSDDFGTALFSPYDPHGADQGAEKHPKQKCSQCDKQFNSVRDLVGHIDSEHKETSTIVFDKICDICKRKFSSDTHLKEHIETDHGAKTISCEECKYTCTSITHLKKHVDAMHNSSNCNALSEATGDPIPSQHL